MYPIKKIFLLISVIGFLLAGCVQKQSKNSNLSERSLESVPGWAKEAIWYQIFVERFRNGDPANDPTPVDM